MFAAKAPKNNPLNDPTIKDDFPADPHSVPYEPVAEKVASNPTPGVLNQKVNFNTRVKPVFNAEDVLNESGSYKTAKENSEN